MSSLPIENRIPRNTMSSALDLQQVQASLLEPFTSTWPSFKTF
jgi:hypothetical protein